MPSNHNLPSAMAIQPPLSNTSNQPVQAHISVPSSQQYTLNVPRCAPLSGQRQVFGGKNYRYRPNQILHGMKTRTI